MEYTIIIEEGESSFGAYVPDLPDCIAVGDLDTLNFRLKTKFDKSPKPIIY